VRLAAERDRLLQARQALEAIRADAPVASPIDRGPRDDAMTITELAEALGVRTSTLRFWEQEGLVAPERVTSLRVRRYEPAEIQSLRIVAALRAAGYRIPAIRDILASLNGLARRDSTAAILQQRLDDVARRSVSLLEAGADLAALLRSRSG
jgi:DNA-binding transcriptional MerR regulator